METEIKKIREKVLKILEEEGLEYGDFAFNVVKLIRNLTKGNLAFQSSVDEGIWTSYIRRWKDYKTIYRITVMNKQEDPEENSEEGDNEVSESEAIEPKQFVIGLTKIEECKKPVFFESLEEFIAEIVKYSKQ